MTFFLYFTDNYKGQRILHYPLNLSYCIQSQCIKLVKTGDVVCYECTVVSYMSYILNKKCPSYIRN